MTVMKEKAVEIIQRIPEDHMLYVINFLQSFEAVSLNKQKDREKAEKALINILNMDQRLPDEFNYKKELQEAIEKVLFTTGKT